MLLLEHSKRLLNLAQLEHVKFHTREDGTITGATVNFPSGSHVELETADSQHLFTVISSALLQAQQAQVQPARVQPVTVVPSSAITGLEIIDARPWMPERKKSYFVSPMAPGQTPGLFPAAAGAPAMATQDAAKKQLGGAFNLDEISAWWDETAPPDAKGLLDAEQVA